MTSDVAVMPVPRFEWERIVRRIVLPKHVKLLALVLATYSDPDGTRVRPGNEVLADVTGDSEKNVRRIMAQLRRMCLIEMVTRGGGRGGKGRASEYRLTIPSDLLDRMELLSPDDRAEDSPDIQVSAQSDSQPVDNSESPDTQMSSQYGRDSPNDRTSDAHPGPIDRTFSAIDRTSRCPTTKYSLREYHQPPPPTVLLPPEGTHDRAREPTTPTELIPAA